MLGLGCPSSGSVVSDLLLLGILDTACRKVESLGSKISFSVPLLIQGQLYGTCFSPDKLNNCGSMSRVYCGVFDDLVWCSISNWPLAHSIIYCTRGVDGMLVESYRRSVIPSFGGVGPVCNIR